MPISRKGGMKVISAEKAIDVRHVTKYYGKHLAIENVSFSVDKGEIFGFIGPNGAGKSTLIRILLNLIFPSQGVARIFGKDVVRESKAVRGMVGYLPSEIHYYEDMRVKDLLAYSAAFYPTGKGNRTAGQAGRKSRIAELAERLQLDLEKKIGDLSFGNRKKAGIIQAMLHEPPLYIFDEPTNGLDPLIQHAFFELIREEREKGATIFFSSHQLAEVQRLCDRVAMIKQGKLLRVEPIEQLMKNQYKKVTLTFAEGRTQEVDWPDVVPQEVSGHTVKLIYKGASQDLIRRLQQLPVTDLLIEEPSLEEIFLHEYEDATPAKRN